MLSLEEVRVHMTSLDLNPPYQPTLSMLRDWFDADYMFSFRPRYLKSYNDLAEAFMCLMNKYYRVDWETLTVPGRVAGFLYQHMWGMINYCKRRQFLWAMADYRTHTLFRNILQKRNQYDLQRIDAFVERLAEIKPETVEEENDRALRKVLAFDPKELLRSAREKYEKNAVHADIFEDLCMLVCQLVLATGMRLNEVLYAPFEVSPIGEFYYQPVKRGNITRLTSCPIAPHYLHRWDVFTFIGELFTELREFHFVISKKNFETYLYRVMKDIDMFGERVGHNQFHQFRKLHVTLSTIGITDPLARVMVVRNLLGHKSQGNSTYYISQEAGLPSKAPPYKWNLPITYVRGVPTLTTQAIPSDWDIGVLQQAYHAQFSLFH